MIPSESNPFARAIASKAPAGRGTKLAKSTLGIMLTLLLTACLAAAVYLFGALLVRAARHHDWLAFAAALLVGAMTYVMARGRRR